MDERKSITKELIETIKASDIISQFKIVPGDIRVGVFYTGVVLSSGHAGMVIYACSGNPGSRVLSKIARQNACSGRVA